VTHAMSTAVRCECSHRKHVHADGLGACATPGCGCTRYRRHRSALPAVLRVPAVVAGTVEHLGEIADAAGPPLSETSEGSTT
jgi:hypothetical protein